MMILGGLVPGLPHLLRPELHPNYHSLATEMSNLGDRLASKGIERLLYYSTGWISVLGHLFQAKQTLKGMHVDENWYDLIDLPFHFKVDAKFASALAESARSAGYQTKLVDYEGFPVDTGTIVADQLINKGRFDVAMVSCCVYSDFADTVALAASLRRCLEQDSRKTAVVAVSGLSGRFFTMEIDLREDHVSSPEDEAWNKRVLGLIEAGHLAGLAAILPEYSRNTKADMGLKAMAFLQGMDVAKAGRPAKCLAYGGIYGTGAAVIEFV